MTRPFALPQGKLLKKQGRSRVVRPSTLRSRSMLATLANGGQASARFFASFGAAVQTTRGSMRPSRRLLGPSTCTRPASSSAPKLEGVGLQSGRHAPDAVRAGAAMRHRHQLPQPVHPGLARTSRPHSARRRRSEGDEQDAGQRVTPRAIHARVGERSELMDDEKKRRIRRFGRLHRRGSNGPAPTRKRHRRRSPWVNPRAKTRRSGAWVPRWRDVPVLRGDLPPVGFVASDDVRDEIAAVDGKTVCSTKSAASGRTALQLVRVRGRLRRGCRARATSRRATAEAGAMPQLVDAPRLRLPCAPRARTVLHEGHRGDDRDEQGSSRTAAEAHSWRDAWPRPGAGRHALDAELDAGRVQVDGPRERSGARVERRGVRAIQRGHPAAATDVRRLAAHPATAPRIPRDCFT